MGWIGVSIKFSFFIRQNFLADEQWAEWEVFVSDAKSRALRNFKSFWACSDVLRNFKAFERLNRNTSHEQIP